MRNLGPEFLDYAAIMRIRGGQSLLPGGVYLAVRLGMVSVLARRSPCTSAAIVNSVGWSLSAFSW
jgi:hypothetical protein